MNKTILLAVSTVSLAATLAAQGPSAEWRTVETKSFRIHYTAPAEPWALRLAGRIEAIRERVATAVGSTPKRVVDIVVRDPIAQANGSALPFLDTPRMELWTTPPGPESALGDSFSDWAEMVALHEDVHLVHMMRRSRSVSGKLLEHALRLGPITRKAPRWVIEGYATMLEGQLTGLGRPNGDFRAAILRRWALAGRLPSYGQMISDSESFLGMSMAYLVGSAYLEWLAERAGPDSPRALWARLTARTRRSFGDAFKGVYGDTTERLYRRFCAEVTWRAMEVERRIGAGRQEGTLWQDLSWATGEPQVSPDGTKLAAVLRSKDGPSRLVVWSTAPDLEAEKKWKERVERQLKSDPEDVAPVRSGPLRRKPLHELVARSGAEPSFVRWLPDGKELLFVRFEPDSEGFLHPDLFRWSPASGSLERLTHGADLRDADVAPDGTSAVAVQHRFGASALLRVELATGTVSVLYPASLDEVYASPRFSPDGRRLAFLRHRDGVWNLVVRDLGGDAQTLVSGADNAAYPAWSPDGRFLYASRGGNGLVDIWRFAAGGDGAPEAVTRSTGALLAPAPTPDGKALFLLALEHDGYDIRHLDLLAERTPGPAEPLTVALAPALRPSRPEPRGALARASVAPPSAYGLGRLELEPLVGGFTSSAGDSLELALRVGDLIGRIDLIAAVGRASTGWIGGRSLAATWRGAPVTLSMHVFSVSERPSEQERVPATLGEALDADRAGVELSAEWRRIWRATELTSRAGVLWSRIDPRASARFDQRFAFVGTIISREPSRGPWSWPHGVEVNWQGGRSDDSSWRRLAGKLELGTFYKDSGLSLAWQRRTVRGELGPFDRIVLGGAISSLLPDAATSNRVLMPALPVGALIGDDYECQHAELMVDGFPLFFARHRAWSRGEARGEWLRVAGLAVDVSNAPLPMLKLPGLRGVLGVARVLDPPLEDRTVWWFGLAYRP